MSLPIQLAAYTDCEAVFAAAIADRRGAKVKLSDWNSANNFRLRLNYYRVLLRREACRLYEPTDPLYNKCEYDSFVNRITEDDGNYYVVVERYTLDKIEIEPISGEPADVEFESDPEPVGDLP